MNADVATALELIFEKDCVPHINTESGTGDIAAKKDRPICSFVSPFVKEVGETSLTI
jgi:hypothetical protein